MSRCYSIFSRLPFSLKALCYLLSFSFLKIKILSFNKQTLLWPPSYIGKHETDIWKKETSTFPFFLDHFPADINPKAILYRLAFISGSQSQYLFSLCPLALIVHFVLLWGTFYFFCLSHRNKYEQHSDKSPWLKWLWMLMFKFEAANKWFSSWIHKKLDSCLSAMERAVIFSSEKTNLQEIHVLEIQIMFLKKYKHLLNIGFSCFLNWSL